ncbi:unnamed protein product [Thelazia callipaeda]|uniref:Type III secretion protein n=1 Tax=Thelazia callipaeda TaxID=103827 RepID=A0A0N5D1I7_THECL|nr:unnamed protein product [Thelazia callipaeda]
MTNTNITTIITMPGISTTLAVSSLITTDPVSTKSSSTHNTQVNTEISGQSQQERVEERLARNGRNLAEYIRRSTIITENGNNEFNIK